MPIYTKGQWLKDDCYMTPKAALADIAELMPREGVVWEAFWGDGKSGQHMRELGFKVHHEPEDFFQTEPRGDWVWSNPPFSSKREILTRLKDLQLPFCLLLPTNVINKQYFRQLFVNDPELQFIIPRKRISFVMKGADTSGCWFDTIWVCWRMGLDRDITWLS